MINLQIEKIQMELSQIISNSQLPVGIILVILQNIVHELQMLYEEQLQIEYKQLQKEKENKGDEIENE